MKLQLYIQGYLFIEEEAILPARYKGRTSRKIDEYYDDSVKYLVSMMKYRNVRAIGEKEYEIFLVHESKMNESDQDEKENRF